MSWTVHQYVVIVCVVSLRLVGNSRPNAGRLEIYYNNTWRSVCGYFSDKTVQVACFMLGFGWLRVFSSSSSLSFIVISWYSQLDLYVRMLTQSAPVLTQSARVRIANVSIRTQCQQNLNLNRKFAELSDVETKRGISTWLWVMPLWLRPAWVTVKIGLIRSDCTPSGWVKNSN